MNKLVVYDSLYGNTEKVALEIAKSISAKAVNVSEIGIADLKDVDLLVVGSPTQGGRPTQKLQAFLNLIPNGSLKGVKTAVFDTRFSESKVGFALRFIIKTLGYAAPRVADILKSKGGKLILPPEGFIVEGKEGPLAEGELERAEKWMAD